MVKPRGKDVAQDAGGDMQLEQLQEVSIVPTVKGAGSTVCKELGRVAGGREQFSGSLVFDKVREGSWS